jgi:hypothetical protein
MRSRNNAPAVAVEAGEDGEGDEEVENHDSNDVDNTFVDEIEEPEVPTIPGVTSTEGCKMQDELAKLRENGKYKKLLAQRSNLPVYRHAAEIVNLFTFVKNVLTLLFCIIVRVVLIA